MATNSSAVGTLGSSSSKGGVLNGSAKNTNEMQRPAFGIGSNQPHSNNPLLIQRQPAVTAQLHPLVALIIADHFNRAYCNAQFQNNNNSAAGNADPHAAASSTSAFQRLHQQITNKNKPAVGKSSGGSGGPLIIGALLGKQDGRHIEITNAVELRYDVIDNTIETGSDGVAAAENKVVDIVIDVDYWREKELQFKQVFPDTDYVGWYIADGEQPTAFLTQRDVHIHSQIMQLHENPLMLKYRPQLISDAAVGNGGGGVADLYNAGDEVFPFELFESVLDMQKQKSADKNGLSGGSGESMQQELSASSSASASTSSTPKSTVAAASLIKFVKIDYNFAIEESERIGITHIAGDAVAAGEQSDDVPMQSATAAATAAGDAPAVASSASLLRTYKSLASSTKMLRMRMHVITEYLRAVQEGKIQPTSDADAAVEDGKVKTDADEKSSAEKSTVLTDEKILKKISGINNKLKLLSRSHFIDAGYLEADMQAGHLVALLGCVNQTQMNLARFASHTLPILQTKETGGGSGGGRTSGGGGFTPFGFDGHGGGGGRSQRRPPRSAFSSGGGGFGRTQRFK